MRIQNLLLVCGLALFMFITGCGTTTTPLPSKAEEPKQVLNTYLEGLRDQDFEKIKLGVSYAVYRSWPVDQKKLIEIFEAQEKSIGAIKKWEFTSEPYFDEVNNQAIIQTRLTTDKAFYVIDYDMRKQTRWYIFGSKMVTKSQVSGQKKSLPGSVTGDSFEKFMNEMNNVNYHEK